MPNQQCPAVEDQNLLRDSALQLYNTKDSTNAQQLWLTFAVVTLHCTSPRCALIILPKALSTPDTLFRRPFSASAADQQHTTQRNVNYTVSKKITLMMHSFNAQ